MSEVLNAAEIFGKNVFNESVMRQRLPKDVFKKMKKTMEDGAGSVHCRSSGSCNEGVGDGARSYPLYSLVSAADRCYG